MTVCMVQMYRSPASDGIKRGPESVAESGGEVRPQ
jgi:hypothetical protein